ncbi:putative Glycosyl hydrolase [Vibrio nigripulchritudo SOn1]|uniref:Glycosyl hydrolase n=1 Tax=Vibrio nigripulchritudo SOn1 TaxID=1238450 RepID=A0AAV2VNZ8_9VIBR|nr:glycoside hydrolase family 88 protein [Vibrio nigripulchritudo]CCO46268.1 putative Glycosyl hydrolase [Vibrio nigripulchritudo SOn1]
MNKDVLGNETIANVADRLLEHPFQGWFYGDSVGFEGLLAASDYLGDNRWSDFTWGFFRGWATRRTPFQLDDNTAPGHIMCSIIERKKDENLKQAIIDLAHHLSQRRNIDGVPVTFEDTLRSLRQPYGGVPLSEEQQKQMLNPGAGIWLDCMHFDPPFYAHLSHIDPSGNWGERAVREILGYRQFLFNPELGLYRHYWLEDTKQSYIDGWGRGQGWALLGLLDVAHYASHVEGANTVKEQAQQLARKMLEFQLPDGNWYAMIHEERSGPESSTAAFMATAFFRGMKAGILDHETFEKPADLAFEAMVKNLDNDGNLMGVSAAVMSALVDEHYWHVPLNKIVPWGQGPVLTALAERKAYLESA